MEGSAGIGFMAAFAISGSVVLIAREVHKRLLSDFMKKIEFELGGSKRGHQAKKRVRFAEDVMEPSSNNKEYRKRHLMRMTTRDDNDQVVLKMEDDVSQGRVAKLLETMPLNRQMLYKGILDYKHDMSSC